MAMKLRLAIVAAMALLWASTAAAHAAAPVFSAPVAIAGGAWPSDSAPPAALLAPDGRATVAWGGKGHEFTDPPTGGEGVFVSELPPGGGAFSPPVKVSDENAGGVQLASNDVGMRALGWMTTAAPEQALTVMLAPAGTGFGPAEHVPIPPRAPATQPGVIEDSRSVAVSSLAVAPDGTLAVTYIDIDRRADNLRGVVVMRRPDGHWTEPQTLDDQLRPPETPVVAADGLGGLHVMWTGAPNDGSSRHVVLYVADAGSDGRFGPARELSEPDQDVDSATAPKLIANRRGDVLAAWEGRAPADYVHPPGTGGRIEASVRSAGGDWSAPKVFSSDASSWAERATAALDDRGDALVVWTSGILALGSVRPAGGDWGPVNFAFAGQNAVDEMPAALDAGGTGLVTAAVAGPGGATNKIVAYVVPPGGKFEPPVTVSSDNDRVSRPNVATDSFGNGLVVWLRGPARTTPSGEPSTVFAAGYSAQPPAVAAFRASKTAFTLRSSEPARVTLTVSGRHRHVTQRSRVHRGANSVAFGKNVRGLLGHHGRFRATVQARDVGPRASRAKTITIKR
jgi:hypothetical protein